MWLEFYRDIDARRQVQPCQRVDSLRSGFKYVNQAFVSPNFKMFSGVFVHMGSANHTETADVSWQRDWPGDTRPGPFGRLYYLSSGEVQHLMVERF